jgi:putative colanic acid biosynthesis glycosyltransferase
MCKISIVTVVRNDLNGLIKTEYSILAQNNSNYEWIIIDGNSTDGTKDYVLNLKYDFLICISENDKGIYDAMNKGINLTNGDYIIFLNAGDEFYDNETLTIVNNTISKYKVDVLFGGANIYFGNNFIYRPPLDINTCINYSLPGHHQSTYYKKTKLNDIQYSLEYEFSGDYALICSLYMSGISTINIDRPLTKFIVGHHSFKNIYKILFYSSRIQKNILKLNNFQISYSIIRRLISTIVVQLTYKFTFLTKIIKLKN